MHARSGFEKLGDGVRRGLEHPGLPSGLALLAMLLCSQSLTIGWILDDDYHRAALTANERLPGVERSPVELFAFVGDRWTLPRDSMPWWASDELRLAFLRPVTGFSHWLDYQLWPEEPMWMHLHSLLWLGLTVLVATVLYRRLAASNTLWVAGLAAVFFALDDAHGIAAVWLANRNALLTMLFGLVSLLAYHLWRRDGWRPGAVGAPIFLLLAVLSGEAAVACGAYLFSYALFLDRGPIQQRLVALAPCATVGVLWFLAYKAMGYGAGGSAIYIDPGAQPLRFLAAVLERGPVLLWGQFGFPPSDLYSFFSQEVARQAWFAMVASLSLLGLLLMPLLRRDSRARFWTVGLLLAVLPSCATIPSTRLLFYVSLGSAGLLATFISRAWGGIDDLPVWWRWSARLVTLPLLLVHLVLSPVGLSATAKNWSGLAKLFTKPAATLPSDPAVREQQAVIVNAPSGFVTGYAPVYQAVRGRAIPAATMTLATSLYPIEVDRLSSRTLALRPHGGFLAPPGSAPMGQEQPSLNLLYIFQTMDAMYRDDEPFHLGQRIERGPIGLEITAVTDEGRPTEVTFHFDTDLEDESWRWLQWSRGELVEWQPPAIGANVTMPAATW